MKLSALLTPDLVIHPLRASDKWDVIRQLARLAVDAGALQEERFSVVHDALVKREQSMTTGMENGIAIPHAAVDDIPDVVAVLGIASEGVPFDTLDGAPAQIVVGLIIPRDKKLLHIKTLAGIAKLLGNHEIRAELIATRSAAEAVAVVQDRDREFA